MDGLVGLTGDLSFFPHSLIAAILPSLRRAGVFEGGRRGIDLASVFVTGGMSVRAALYAGGGSSPSESVSADHLSNIY